MFRLKEAMDYASEQRGRKVTKTEIGNLLFADSNDRSRFANVKNLLDGATKRIEIEQVEALTSYLGVTSDYLFGLSDKPTSPAEDVAKLQQAIAELNYISQTIK